MKNCNFSCLFGKDGKFVANEQNIKLIATEIIAKKGIASVVCSTNVTMPGADITEPAKIQLILRGGYTKCFEILDNIIYEDGVAYKTVKELLKMPDTE